MSGGSYDYAHHHVERFADALDAGCDYQGMATDTADSPERRDFAALLRKVAAAMKAVEWVDSYDCSPPHDTLAIRAALLATVD